MFDVKLIRPNVQSIIAGPFDTQEEAQMYATQYALEFQKWIKQKREEIASGVFPDELDRQVAERDLEKYIKDNTTLYEVVEHKRGGI